ncbi:MAG: hypothetical protein R3F61_14605 [Myxococcota bacterium]
MSTGDLENAPPAVREAAAHVERERRRSMWAQLGIAGLLFTSALATSLLHDVGGVSELMSAIPLGLGLVSTIGSVAWLTRRPRTELAASTRTVERYRQLDALGLTWVDGPEGEAPSGLDRVAARIRALATDRPDVQEAARAAQERFAGLQSEIVHLDAAIAADPALRDVLSGVRDRLDSECTRIRADLAELWAGLLELSSEQAGEGGLDEAMARLRADAEVASAGRRAQHARARQTQR